MNYQTALERLKLKFTSGNQTEVERAAITREEFEALTSAVVLTRDCIGEIVAVTRQDEEGRILDVIGEKLTDKEQYDHMREYWKTMEVLDACKQEYASLDKIAELGAYHRSVEDQE